MKPTLGRTPKTGDRELRIKYRNGQIDPKPRKARDMVWDDRGYDWDIVEVEYWESGK